MLRTLALFALLAAVPASAATVYTLSTNLFDADPYTVTSFSFDGGLGLGTIIKAPDSATDDLFLAVALGTVFTQWTLTEFDDALPGPPQTGQFIFHNVIATSFQTLPSGDEQITFEAEIPEPSTLSLLLLGGLPLLWLRRRPLSTPPSSPGR